MVNESMTSPIFITGVPRSGTTLVSMMLNGHSAIRIAPETHYFGKYYREGNRRKCLETEDKYREFINHILYGEHISFFDFSDDDKIEIIECLTQQSRSHSEVLSKLLSTYAHKYGKYIWGDKSPENLLYIDSILENFPGARFIHIIRDPRDVALSLRKVYWHTGNILSSLRLWKKYSIIAISYKDKYSDKFHIVRYEDILDSPYSSCREICLFLGIDFEQSMVNYHESVNPIFDANKHPWKYKNLQPVDSNNKGKWINHMRPYECYIVDKLIGDHLEQWGYPKSGHRPGIITAFMWVYLILENLVFATQFKAKSAYLRLRNSY